MTSQTLSAPAATVTSFTQLDLIEPLLRALKTEGYVTPTPIQALAVPYVLAGRDLLGWAQTGTGKTAAFALPVLQNLLARQLSAQSATGNVASLRRIRCLVLAPTRELAHQIAESFGNYGRHTGLRHTVVFGGVGMQPQIDALRRGVDVLIATPGRLLDLMNQGFVSLSNLEIFILDEADRMLDMGFIHDIRKVIAKLPAQRQTLMFSATMAPEIQKLAEGLLKDPARVEVAPISSTAETITQSLYFVEKKEKTPLLRHLLETEGIKRALVFTRTKHMANRVAEALSKSGIGAEAFHSNKSQNARLRALGNFKSGATRTLVATDIAARGIDIDEITHVFNYDLPNEPEVYVHRIGRTGRAGVHGFAMSFCAMEEREFLPFIERTIQRHIPVVTEHPQSSPEPLPHPTNLSGGRPRGGQAQGQRAPQRASHSQGPGQGQGRGQRDSRPPRHHESDSGFSGRSGAHSGRSQRQGQGQGQSQGRGANASSASQNQASRDGHQHTARPPSKGESPRAGDRDRSRSTAARPNPQQGRGHGHGSQRSEHRASASHENPLKRGYRPKDSED